MTAAVGALCPLLVQILPWGGVETEGFSGFGFAFPGADVDSYTWQMEANGQDEGWYSEDFDDSDGIGQKRTAIPFLLAGLVMVAISAVFGFGRSGPAGTVVLVGGLVSLVGVVLFATGTDAMYDGGHEWAAAFHLGIAGTAFAVLGGAMALTAGDASGMRTTG